MKKLIITSIVALAAGAANAATTPWTGSSSMSPTDARDEILNPDLTDPTYADYRGIQADYLSGIRKQNINYANDLAAAGGDMNAIMNIVMQATLDTVTGVDVVLTDKFNSLDAMNLALSDGMTALNASVTDGFALLNDKVDSMEQDMSAGIAAAAALSSVAVADVKKGEVSVGGGYGSHNGESAAAVGFAIGLTDTWSVNAGAGFSSADTTFRAGTNYKFKAF